MRSLKAIFLYFWAMFLAQSKKAVGELHDVGLVYRGDLFSTIDDGVVESKLGNARRGFFRDDFQTFHDTRHHFVLDTRVLAFGVFAHHDQVDIFIARLDPGKIFNWPEISVEIETLA